jgi:hypothetical protein
MVSESGAFRLRLCPICKSFDLAARYGLILAASRRSPSPVRRSWLIIGKNIPVAEKGAQRANSQGDTNSKGKDSQASFYYSLNKLLCPPNGQKRGLEGITFSGDREGYRV